MLQMKVEGNLKSFNEAIVVLMVVNVVLKIIEADDFCTKNISVIKVNLADNSVKNRSISEHLHLSTLEPNKAFNWWF
jgi:hypothetical protein